MDRITYHRPATLSATVRAAVEADFTAWLTKFDRTAVVVRKRGPYAAILPTGPCDDVIIVVTASCDQADQKVSRFVRPTASFC